MGIKKLYIGGENEDWEIPVTPLPKVHMILMHFCFVYNVGHAVITATFLYQLTQFCWVAGQNGSHARSNRPFGLLRQEYANLLH